MVGSHCMFKNPMRNHSNASHYHHHTVDDWNLNNKLKCECSEEQEKLADKIIAHSDHVIEQTRHATEEWKREVDHRLQERTEEIRFLIEELNKEKREACLEEEALKTYCQRIANAIETLQQKILTITLQCVELRRKRIGIDLVQDEVDHQLDHELKCIKKCLDSLKSALKDTCEQTRRLRAKMHLLDQDLGNKDVSLQIDECNLNLKESQLGLQVHQNKIPFHKCNSSIPDWELHSSHNIEATAKEINSAIQLRSFVDILLKQVTEDVHNHVDRSNEAFQRRISEVRYAKQVLEAVHNQTMKQINEIERNISRLEKELAEKEGYVGVCHMRIANRAQRPHKELVCDQVHSALTREVHMLQDSIVKLSKMIEESKGSKRYLLHSQVLQEEEMNIKANSLKIDEVECMTIRQGLDIPFF